MSIAVTGATGFVGRHVVAELERRALSATLACRPGAVMLPVFSHHSVVRFDVNDPPADAFELMGRPDTLIHLAWGGLPNYHSLHHFELQLPAQYQFIKHMVTSGLTNCLITGTCFEYGLQEGCLGEDAETRPMVAYGFAKDALRRQLEYLRDQRPFNLTWARLFYLHGEGQSPTSLLPQLRHAVEQGQREFGMSGGEQQRDYLPVAQVASYLVSLALTGRDNGVVNVCSGTPVSVREIAERWIAENGWTITLALGRYPYADYEPMAFWGDTRKLRAVTAPVTEPQAS